MTRTTRDDNIATLTQALLRECRIYFVANGQTQDSLFDVLKAIALAHTMLFWAERSNATD
jgi:hypothetical protein